MAKVTEVVGLVLPAVSVCDTESVTTPSGKAVGLVNVHAPLGSTVAVPMGAPVASKTVTVAPGSHVPINVGVLSEVELPDAGLVMTGAPDAFVSIVKLDETAEDVLPAASVAIAVMVSGPSERDVDVVNV